MAETCHRREKIERTKFENPNCRRGDGKHTQKTPMTLALEEKQVTLWDLDD
jgi:hypothetical protein